MDDAWTLSTKDLAGLGLGPGVVRQLVRGGQLVRLRRGVYRRPLPSDAQSFQDWAVGEPERRHRFLLEAALPSLAGDSVFSHVSAATVHDLPVPARLLQKVCILRPGSGSGSVTRSTHRRYAPLPASDITDIGGLPVTTLVRTVVDLSRVLPFAEGVAVADAGLAKGLQRQQLLDALGPRRPHNAKARAVLEFADARSESPGESRCRAMMRLAGVPIPTLQFHVRDERGVEVARTDYAWEELGVAGEFDTFRAGALRALARGRPR